ncbi:MAG: UDP-N-acetylmuramoyl-L-alanyl-D-glutamate--2,6-diaminopimelate ligase [Synergistaceae bacterium]|nr:UDP-N-acetylmuramoyl-L-alanyl-D-glutamate--2,6-diaminopimelate ligase [Synergistaceae bacterium]
MNFNSLFSHLQEAGFSPFMQNGHHNPRLTGIAHDSRKVMAGDLFCCVPGLRADGHWFVDEALQRGASAILCRQPLALQVPQLIVAEKDIRRAMGQAAALFYGFPAEKLRLIAVTGTNGKSTSAYMLRHLISKAGFRCGLIGTIIYSDGANDFEAERTTPENCDIQRLLAQMVTEGCDYCVMEASSHGLEQGRLEGCLFEAALFTNLTPEHLDYHVDMECYFQAKKLLFDKHMKINWLGVANVDDRYGYLLWAEWPEKITPFSLHQKISGGCTVLRHSMTLEGINLDINLPNGEVVSHIKIPMTGRYNIHNALGALALASRVGVELNNPSEVFSDMPQVPGRMEKYSFANGVTVIIDYAHSPDALQNVLGALREVTKGKIISVFGLGGERYVNSRPAMGEIAATLSDYVFITSDNPRSEDPKVISEQIAKGILRVRIDFPYWIIIDRREAINEALALAESGDVVFIGGKGPERFIVYSDHKIPFNDTEAVREWASRNKMELLNQ